MPRFATIKLYGRKPPLLYISGVIWQVCYLLLSATLRLSVFFKVKRLIHRRLESLLQEIIFFAIFSLC